MEENSKFICDVCHYKTNRPTEWIKHIKSQKHLRRGEKKITKCDICDYETSSHWNIKLHKITQHSTKEEREKQKYYCDICDSVYLCKLYMEKHLQGKKHNNMIEAIKLMDELKNN